MCAYEFYWFDKTDKAHFIGILKEKRKNLLRITRESVLNLGMFIPEIVILKSCLTEQYSNRNQ